MAGWQLSSKCKQFLLPPSVEEEEALAACLVAQFALEIRLDSGFKLREQKLYMCHEGAKFIYKPVTQISRLWFLKIGLYKEPKNKEKERKRVLAL